MLYEKVKMGLSVKRLVFKDCSEGERAFHKKAALIQFSLDLKSDKGDVRDVVIY